MKQPVNYIITFEYLSEERHPPLLDWHATPVWKDTRPGWDDAWRQASHVRGPGWQLFVTNPTKHIDCLVVGAYLWNDLCRQEDDE